MHRSLSVIIPAFNEELRLPQTLQRIVDYLRGSAWESVEVLVVDDGSTDRTSELTCTFAASHCRIRLLRNPGNCGKGYSVRHGMTEAQGDWRLLTDADLSTPIEELETLWKAVEQTGSDIVIGSRALNATLIGVHQPAFREWAGKCFNLVMRLAVGLPIRDTQCGFKLFSRAAAEVAFPRQRIDRFGFDVEVLFIAKLHGFRINEVAVRWNHVEGTKVGLWNGAQSFFDLFVIRRNQIAGDYR